MAEFDRTAAPAAEPAQTDQNFDQLVNELLGPSQDVLDERAKNQELQGQISALRQAEYERAETAAFESYAETLQSRLPEHLPPDYARNALLAAAAQDGNLLAAWRYRNADRNAIQAEYSRLQLQYRQIAQGPDIDGRKAQVLAEMQQRGDQLVLAYNSGAMLKRAEREIEQRAHDYKPIDREMTQMRMDVAFAVKGSSAKIQPDPPPRLGNLSDREYREYLKELGINGY